MSRALISQSDADDFEQEQLDDEGQAPNRCSNVGATPALLGPRPYSYMKLVGGRKHPRESWFAGDLGAESECDLGWWRDFLSIVQLRQVDEIKADSNQTCKTLPVQSFYPEAVEIVKPFDVVVSGTGENFVATFFDANLNASGDTEEEAFSNLKDVIVATFELLTRTLSKEELGPGQESN